MRHHQVIRYALGAIPLALLASYLYARASLLFSGTSERGDAVILAPEGGQSGEYLRLAGEGLLIAEPKALSAAGDSLPDPDTASLFGFESSPWSAAYLLNPRQAMRESPITANALAERPQDRLDLPCLIFFRNDGASEVLEPGIDFDGKAPLMGMGGKTAPVYGRFALNTPAQDRGAGLAGIAEGSISIGYSERGRMRIRELGIPESLPAAIGRKTALTSTLLLNADLSTGAVSGALPGDPLIRWYRSTMAAYYADSRAEAYWKVYVPLLFRSGRSRPPQSVQSQSRVTKGYEFKTGEGKLWRRAEGGKWEPFTVKGVNLGPALPGRGFTEFPKDPGLYLSWFSGMRDLNLNALRVYTLLPPEFYRALRSFNAANPGRELCLLQEIWPEEHPPEGNLLDGDYTAAFLNEIDLTVKALHGEADVPQRKGRAWGLYDADVSPWTAAYLIGRELESEEVIRSNAHDPERTYRGTYISAPAGPTTEAWLAEACDHAAKLEATLWGVSRPLSVVNWPPLDPIPHWVEWRDPEIAGGVPANDRVSVATDRIEVNKSWQGGFFVSWHIYPNYPDFMVTTPWYSKWKDEEGPFPYGGYLRELRMFNPRHPILIAEYGLSTSRGVAHVEPGGLNHGGVSESLQGRGIVRMTKAALAEGYAGTVIFEWIDEWAKQTWTTAPFMIPLAGHQSWHNLQDPEQFYGLNAIESAASRETVCSKSSGPVISEASLSVSEEGLYLTLEGFRGWASVPGRLLVGIDAMQPGSGIRRFTPRPSDPLPPGMPKTRVSFEFLADLTLPLAPIGEETGALLAADAANPSRNAFSTGKGMSTEFQRNVIMVNRPSVDSLGRLSPPAYYDASSLKTGSDVRMEGEETLILRIPWALINCADPSRRTFLDDERLFEAWPSPDTLRVSPSESITLQGLYIGNNGTGTDWFPRKGDELTEALSVPLRGWVTPDWKQRRKDSWQILTDFFGTY